MSTIDVSPTEQRTPVGVISTDIIEQLSPYVPIANQQQRSRRRRAAKRKIRFRTSVRRKSPSGNTRAVLTSATLLISDLVTILASYTVAHLLMLLVLGGGAQVVVPTIGCAVLCASYIAIAIIQGLYPGTALSPVFEFRQVVVSVLLSSLLATFFVFSFSAESLPIVAIFMLAGMVAAFVLPLARAVARHFWARWSWWGERVIIIGTGPQARAIYDFYNRSPHRGLKPIGFVDEPTMTDSNAEAGRRNSVTSTLGSITRLAKIANRYGVRWGIVAPGGCDGLDMLQVMNYSGALPNIIVLPSQFSLPSLWSSHRECAGVMGVRVCDYLHSSTGQFLKRSFDILGASVGLLLAIPVFVVSAIWIKLRSPGPVFYGHTRLGTGEREFKAWKFRTMVVDADKVLEQYLMNDPEMRREWFEDQKLKKDPRVISGIGNLLRKTSLDEIPQLWNVLAGDMSLVGPRPIVRSEVQKYEQMIGLYFRVRPGLTGLWQVSGRNNTSYSQRVRLDSYYVCNWSLWLDLYIIARTFKTILKREGAY